MADIRKRTRNDKTSYQVRYSAPGTKSGKAYKSFGTLKEAKAFVESGAIQEVATAKSSKLTVSEATDEWLQICKNEGLNGREPVTHYTCQDYQYRTRFIHQYDWPKPMGSLTSPDIVEFRSWLLRQAPSRVVASKVLSTLYSIFKEMALRGRISHNVVSGVSIRSESRYKQPAKIPTIDEIGELLASADRLANSKNVKIARAWRRYRPMLYLAVDSGMRPQEYLALPKPALHENGVYVEQAIDGGGGEITVTKTSAGRRFINLSSETLSMVRHYSETYVEKNLHDLVFPSESGRWQCRRNWQRRGFNVACLDAGLAGDEGKPLYRPYDLRHFFASMLIAKKTDLKRLQTLMGHSNIETTLNVYGHLIEDGSDNQDGGLINLIR